MMRQILEKNKKEETRSKRSKSTELSCKFVIRPSSANKELTVLLRKCKQTGSPSLFLFTVHARYAKH